MGSLWRFYSFGKCYWCVHGWPFFADQVHHLRPGVTWCESVKCENVAADLGGAK